MKTSSTPGRILVPASCAALALITKSVLMAAPVTLQNATATYSQVEASYRWDFSVAKAIDGVSNDGSGWGIAHYTLDLGTEGGTFSETAVFETAFNIGFSPSSLLTFNIAQYFGGTHNVGRFRLSITTDNRSLFADGLTTGGDVTANWTILNPATYTSTGGSTLTKLGDNSILASGTNPDTDYYTITAPTSLTGITGIRLELMEDPSLAYHGPGRNPENGNLKVSEFTVDITAVPEPSMFCGWRSGKTESKNHTC